MTGIGERIKQRRIELGLTQEELAQKMGYKSKSTINKIELGINDVNQSKIVQFARVLDSSVSYLMGWDDEPFPSGKDHVFEDKDRQTIVNLLRKMNGESIDNLLKYARYIYDMENNK